MAIALAHKEYLLGAFHRVLSLVTLLVCLLTEVSIFTSERHATMYLFPLCSILLLYRHAQRASTTSINLVDFSCLKPPSRLRTPIPKFIEHIKLGGCFDDGGVEFMSKAVVASGMGDETYFPPSLHLIPPDATHRNAVEEARMLLFPALDDLFAKTGVPPSAVGVLVFNCSGFCPEPSLAAMVANHYRMCGDVRTFNVSGMGCSAGVVGIDVASNILLTHPTTVSYAIVASTEVITVGWYNGRDHSKLLLNCTFRNGCSAVLLTNRRGVGVAAAKYRLLRLVRTNLMANDDSYRSGYREEDDEGITGFNVGRRVGGAFEEVLRAHLVTLGVSVLPWREKLRFAAAFLLSLMNRNRPGGGGSSNLVPNFGAAAEHFCLPTTWAPMIRRLGRGIGLGEKQMEAAVMTYHRFGNQSAASLWYQLAYHEAKGVVRKGDKVWQLGVGTGLKVNSVVWERVAADDDLAGVGGDGRKSSRHGQRRGPWMDCIHRYPV